MEGASSPSFLFMDTLDALRTKFRLMDIIDLIKYKLAFAKNHPDWFEPDGIIVFCGPQGAGKTLSAVQYVSNLMRAYPKAVLCTNVIINGFKDRTIWFDGVDKFKSVTNGEYGVIYLIDEIQILFNSLESKNLDLNLFTTICQQRKQRKHIVGTAQVFGRIAKGFREQFKWAVMCRKYLGFLQWNRIVKGEEVVTDSDGNMKFDHVWNRLFIHAPRFYEAYDTYATIDRTNFNYTWEGVG